MEKFTIKPNCYFIEFTCPECGSIDNVDVTESYNGIYENECRYCGSILKIIEIVEP